MAVRIAVILVVACAPVVPHEARRPVQAPACRLVAPATTVTPLAIDGYPVHVARRTPAELDAYRRELEKRVPHWDLELNRDGFVVGAESEPIGTFEETIANERVERVRDFVHALHAEIGVPADATPVVALNKYVVVREPAGPEISVEQVGAPHAQLRGVSAGLPDHGRALREQHQHDVVLKLTVTRPRTTLPPNMPAGARELTDAALREMWKLADDRELLVTVSPNTRPCDPVGPNDCRRPDYDTAFACVPVPALRFVRSRSERGDVLRHVVQLASPTENEIHFDYGREGRSNDGYSRPAMTPQLPQCLDAFTGEDLTNGSWCPNPNM